MPEDKVPETVGSGFTVMVAVCVLLVFGIDAVSVSVSEVVTPEGAV
jgi:hypothetical protein